MTGYNHYSDCTCGWCVGGYRGGGGGRGGYTAISVTSYSSYFPGINLRSYISYTIPNATCPVCGATVFFHQASNGGRVFFDELGPPWPKHPCTDNSVSTSSRSAPSKEENMGAFGHALSKALTRQETSLPIIIDNYATQVSRDSNHPQWKLDGWEPVYVEYIKKEDTGSEVTFVKVKDGNQIKLSFDSQFIRNNELPIFIKKRKGRDVFDVSRLFEDATFEDIVGYTHHVHDLSAYTTHPLKWCEKGGWDPIRVISVTVISENSDQSVSCISVQKVESGQEISLRIEGAFTYDRSRPLFMREKETIDVYDIADLTNIIRDVNGGETNFFVGHALRSSNP